jgi:phosphohistidine phosphatase
MRLYIMRHGIARSLGGPILRDVDRPLTPEGVERTGQVADHLLHFCGELNWVASSPLLRACQTAEIVCTRFRTEPDLLEDLQPGGDLEGLFAQLRRKGAASSLWVSHMPEVAELAALCLTGRRDGAGLQFKKDAVAAIHFPKEPRPGHGILEWLLQAPHPGSGGRCTDDT